MTTLSDPIPDAECYVVSIDSFMSGWGVARDRCNVCVVPCRNMIEATRIAAWVRKRPEQKEVRVALGKPMPSKRVMLSHLAGWREHALGVKEDTKAPEVQMHKAGERYCMRRLTCSPNCQDDILRHLLLTHSALCFSDLLRLATRIRDEAQAQGLGWGDDWTEVVTQILQRHGSRQGTPS